jgi:glucose/arabinose dehydrogenase
MLQSASSGGSNGSTVDGLAGARRPRRGAVLAAAALLALAAAPAGAQPLPDLALEVMADGLPQITGITHAGDGRLFVTLQEGRVLIVADGAVLPQPFLDIRGQVGFGGEQGLLSLAFHPDYAANGWFFVNYTDNAGDTVIARFRVSDDANRAQASNQAVLLRIDQPFANHNGGQLAFGQDGMLYVATGDGGSGNDPLCNAQDLSNLLGKILRLDVDAGAGAPPFHSVPPDNPFVGQGTARGEIWAYGLRNPWRFSFDRVTGALFIGDVGQSAMEEIDFLAAGVGGANFGWKVVEGTHCTLLRSGCTVPLPPCSSPLLVRPILTYPNGGG